MYLEILIILLFFFIIIFIFAQILKDNSIVDLFWGLGFVISATYSFFNNNDKGLKGLLITLAISIWGIRLTYHLAKRNIGKPEDYRYALMRKRWGNKYIWLKSFINVYFLQWVIQYVVTLPVIYGNISNQNVYWYNWIGVVLWGIGFFFEAVGDYQLKQFKMKPENKGKLMDSGLWSLTRHPNYFGDTAMWFGIFFIAITDIGGVWIIVGPCLMSFFLVFVSGVKMLEKKYIGRPDFEAYKNKTSAFIPWFPKKDNL